MTTKDTPKKSAKKPKPFADQVLAKLGKKPQTTAALAVKLGLAVDAEGKPTTYAKAKVSDALRKLIAEGKAANVGQHKRDAAYVKVA